MNEVRKTIINPQETAGEGMKVNGMTRGMLYGKDFSKAAALCAKIAVPDGGNSRGRGSVLRHQTQAVMKAI